RDREPERGPIWLYCTANTRVTDWSGSCGRRDRWEPGVRTPSGSRKPPHTGNNHSGRAHPARPGAGALSVWASGSLGDQFRDVYSPLVQFRHRCRPNDPRLVINVEKFARLDPLGSRQALVRGLAVQIGQPLRLPGRHEWLHRLTERAVVQRLDPGDGVGDVLGKCLFILRPGSLWARGRTRPIAPPLAVG